ncbi:MAG: hypothetical protein JW762_08270 [Dehalococcoidales bacterium]|nr:hypothetical protein [Dehalococcoidales bacterium]
MTDNKRIERENNSVEKASFEQVPTSRAADRVLRRRRRPRRSFPTIFRNIWKLVRGTGSR